LFRVTTSGEYTPLHTFGEGCYCPLTQGSDGIIYGATINGPAPRALQFIPQTGAPGTKVHIWGYNLLSATVQFNGVTATAVTNAGSNYVWAVVPAGVTSGPITVTTPGGVSITPGSFTVE
jgi:hypothetical protein